MNNIYGSIGTDRTEISGTNSFICGLLRKTTEETSSACNEGGSGGLDMSQLFGHMSGRAIRFIVNLNLAVVDLALQILSCVTYSAEVLVMGAERRLRHCKTDELYYNKPVTLILSLFRYYVTGASLDYVAQDLWLFDHEDQLQLTEAKLDLFFPYYQLLG